MTDATPIILYTTPNGAVRIEVQIRNETVWLTQKALAALFGVKIPAISKHLKSIFATGELTETAVVSISETTAADGKNYQVSSYNLDAIIAVGYRVNSHQATQFRIWATRTLREFITKGFVLDDERLKQGKTLFGNDYFDELLERIREIRASERRFYQKITDLYALASDYSAEAAQTREFFAAVQNKLHWAITGKTAAETIHESADATKPAMGLTTWKHAPHGKVLKSDVSVAKNYLNAAHVAELNRIVSAYLDLAENRAQRGIVTTMADWATFLNRYLTLADYPILADKGTVSALEAKLKTEAEYEVFRQRQDQDYVSDFDREIKRLEGRNERERSPMSVHKEISFEVEICQHLAANGWLYSEGKGAEGDAAGYDRAKALFPADVLVWVQTTQPQAWEVLSKNHGAKAADTLLTRLRDQLDQRGTLEVLRHGIDLLGLKQSLKLAEFKPALAINPEILARHAANRLRVVRQVRYSLANENSIDLVLFLNGVPVATVELKTDFTQSLTDAIDQYRFDRQPQPKGQAAEPLLSFPRGALVHFAVSNSAVAMVTNLAGPATRFLPFNLGNHGGAGNPGNPTGHRTAYLWEQVWARDSWLEILGRYLIAKRDAKKQLSEIIFPRYHQLDVTRKLQAAILAEVTRRREDAEGKDLRASASPRETNPPYLVQHSAGSGKTNSIAWTAHFLAELHGTDHKKVFDSVVVISDRTVIDDQLQEALFSFQRQTGVVATITNEVSSKSTALAEALSGAKKIVVCTIQTFPFALAAVRNLAATEGKRFAVIADEAHSSQTGQTATMLKSVLSPEELAELEDGGEVSSEDILAAQMAARAGESGITFIAFTATPKAKTLELFGTRPDPSLPAGKTNLPAPFHVYSMRQAIEEGFILDVLQNYTTYKLAFKLAHGGKDYDQTTVERSAALKSIMGWVRLHPYNISQKVQIVVEHFRAYVAPLLNGRAKAMVVVGSRVEAVRWQVAIRKYISEHGYPIGTLVAFSGEVNDKDSGPDGFTERSTSLNPGLKGDIREAFTGDDYRILLVANKFQTGFDQPLLCGMYVDKRLAGIQAVQTLSRLNRSHPGKDTTYVVDFVNDAEEVLAAFKTYHTTAELSATTDPNLVLNLRAKLDAAGHYDDHEVDRVVAVELDSRAAQSELIAALEPVADRLVRRYKTCQEALKIAKATNDKPGITAASEALEALRLFKADLGTFVRAYTFLSQIFDYGNTAIEKRSIFFKRLLPLLEFDREREGIDLSKVVLTHHNLKNQGKRTLALGAGATAKLNPLTESGSGRVQEKEKAYLAELIEKVNSLFDGELTDDDKLVYVNNVIKGKLLESETLRQQAANNSKEQFANSPDLRKEHQNAIMSALDAHTAMSTQALNSPELQRAMLDILLNHSGLWEALRAKTA